MNDKEERKERQPEEEAGEPGGGKGRRDEVGRSGVYPASDPNAPGGAEVRGQQEWGQGERGAAGYENHGQSELTSLWEEEERGKEERRRAEEGKEKKPSEGKP
ncbi:MAG: hypothetical protein M0Z94_05860 [Dehalococcoidales bacterium]|nr:hypothetical protein [Dehalococcoidales bacterium]